MDSLDDRSDEHALARAFCSIGAESFKNRVRFNLSHVSHDGRRLEYRHTPQAVWKNGQLVASLAAIAQRRARTAAEAGDREALRSKNGGTTLSRIARFVSRDIDEARLARLIVGYALIDPDPRPAAEGRDDSSGVPVQLAALRAMLDGIPAPASEDPPALDPIVLSLLAADQERKAFERLFHRLRVSGYVPRSFADASSNVARSLRAPRYAAAGAFPLDHRFFRDVTSLVNRTLSASHFQEANS